MVEILWRYVRAEDHVPKTAMLPYEIVVAFRSGMIRRDQSSNPEFKYTPRDRGHGKFLWNGIT